MSNTLIVYYSHSGNTRKMAKIITEQLHADCLEIIPQKSYPQAYNAVVNQAKHEISQNYQPDIKDIQIDLNKYSTIFIGSPNWWSTIAPPILTFIMQNQNHLINKELIPSILYSWWRWLRSYPSRYKEIMFSIKNSHRISFL